MVSTELLICLIPLLPLIGFLVIGLNVHKLSHKISSYLACGTVLISFVFSLIVFFGLLSITESERAVSVKIISWINTAGFSANLAFLVDPLSSVMLLIITGV